MPTIQPVDAAPGAATIDYDIDDVVVASTPAQLKAIGHPTRGIILHLVLERAATTTELSEALGIPKGTVGYHLDVLRRAGLVRVVATRRVRALTAKYYGRTGRTIVIKGDHLGDGRPVPLLAEAMDEASASLSAGLLSEDSPVAMFTLRHVRLSTEDAATFSRRLEQLALEFSTTPRSGDTVYGLLAGIYPTTLPLLRDRSEEDR